MWFKRLFSRRRLFAEPSEEIREHLEEKIEELVASGMSRKEAAAAARREFGNVTLIEEDSRAAWRWPSVEELLLDLRYALRQLRKNPGFTSVIVLTFALCVGVNTVNFSLPDAIFLRPLGNVPHSGRMVRVAGVHSDGYHFLIAPANFLDFQSQSRSFASLEAYIEASHDLGGDSAPERLNAAKVTSGFFRMLSAAPLFGREFSPEPQFQTGNQAVILSYNLWQRRFGGDPKIVGQPVRLEGQPIIVVGVMPRNFDFPAATQIWLPLALEPSDLNDRLTRRFSVVGKLREGASLHQAQAEVSGIAARIGQSYPGPERLVGADIRAIRDVINGNLTPIFISTMTGAMGFLLLLGCVNVAGMQLSRAAARQREIALRTALGASRGRQLLTESLLLSFFGGIAGLLAARWGVAATGMRISEALGLETKHITNHGRTIEVRQQVERDTPRIIACLKTNAAYRDVDLHPDVAEFLQRYIGDKPGLLFATRNGTPHLHNNIEDRWLTERLKAMGLDEPGMGWHAFRRFRKTWLRGKRCQEDINIFWMGHKPKTTSEIYSHLFEEIDMRLAEAEAAGFGFDLPKNPFEKAVVAPIAPRFKTEVFQEVAVSA
jgi:integrase